VIWKIKRGVLWHDGAPLTADDVVFTAQYAADPDTATFTTGNYAGMKFEKIDSHTVRVVFDQPTPFWPGTYSQGAVLPRHLFAPYAGAKSRDAPTNFKPVGTGPYRFVEFKPGDLLKGELNPNYHVPNQPNFDRIEIKGGGDAVSSARAVLQTGEYDYGWNLLVEDEILQRMEGTGAKGRVAYASGASFEFVLLNAADPAAEIDGERASPKSRHPVFSDPAVRRAFGLLMDRSAMQQFIYGRAGAATPNVINSPARFRSPNLKMEFSVEKANAVLDAAGWLRGADGVRAKGGRKLKFLFQTSISAPRQKVQALIKQAAQKAGIEIELKAVTASVYFSSDVANPDTNTKFWADIEMYAWSATVPDPARIMRLFVSWEAASKANKWQGQNTSRWRNDEYDAAYRASEAELDPVKRAALFIRMNDIVCGDGHVIPLLHRKSVAGLALKLQAPLSGWDYDLASLPHWFRDT
jgi:peptide/nickel transport system substrate-binding protein